MVRFSQGLVPVKIPLDWRYLPSHQLPELVGLAKGQQNAKGSKTSVGFKGRWGCTPDSVPMVFHGVPYKFP